MFSDQVCARVTARQLKAVARASLSALAFCVFSASLIILQKLLISYRGFYDSALEWVGLEGVQIVGSMHPSSTLGRTPLASRFASVVRLLHVGSPSRDDLQDICGAYVAPILAERAAGTRWSGPKEAMRSELCASRITS